MGCKAGWCKTSTQWVIFIVTPSPERWSTKTKEVLSPHEVRLALLNTNPALLHHVTSIPLREKANDATAYIELDTSQDRNNVLLMVKGNHHPPDIPGIPHSTWMTLLQNEKIKIMTETTNWNIWFFCYFCFILVRVYIVNVT